MSFTSTPRGARLARRLASQRLDDWGYAYESDLNVTVTLVVAELVANAVTHGQVPGRDFRLCLVLDVAAGVVRVEVTDTRDDRMPPETPSLPPEPDAESGRGLCLVSALASRWTVAPRAGACRTGTQRLSAFPSHWTLGFSAGTGHSSLQGPSADDAVGFGDAPRVCKAA